MRVAEIAVDGHSPTLVHQQPVADSARGLEMDRIGGIGLDLAAQAVDLHVHRALAAAVGELQELVPLDGVARAAGERSSGCRARGR